MRKLFKFALSIPIFSGMWIDSLPCFPFFIGASAVGESSFSPSEVESVRFGARDFLAVLFTGRVLACDTGLSKVWKNGHGFPERSTRFRCSSLVTNVIRKE